MFRWLFPKIKYYYAVFLKQNKEGHIIVGSVYCEHENEFDIISIKADFPNEVVEIINVVEISKKQWKALVEGVNK